MRAPTIVSIFALLAGDCFASLKPVSVPVTIVPIAFSGKTDSLDDVFLTVNVDVGTPAVRMNLTLDFGWDSSILFDSSPSSLKCYTVAPRHYCNASASSTFYRPSFNLIYSRFWLGYPYGGACNDYNNPDSWTSGRIAQDTWKIGDQSVPSVTFVYAQNYSSLLSNRWASDGILGFSVWGDCADHQRWNDNKCSTAAQTLIGKNGVVSLYLQRPSARVTTAIPSGSLTFGGKDSEHCTGWTALDKSAYYNPWSWSATLDGVVLGPNSFFNVNPTAVFDTTTEFIYTSSYDDIVKTLNAEYDWTSDRYVVQCAAVKSFPDIIFGLSGKDYPLPATDYARQTALDEGKTTCTLMFSDYGDSAASDTWTLGTTFLRNYCVALDFGSQLVNIARLKA